MDQAEEGTEEDEGRAPNDVRGSEGERGQRASIMVKSAEGVEVIQKAGRLKTVLRKYFAAWMGKGHPRWFLNWQGDIDFEVGGSSQTGKSVTELSRGGEDPSTVQRQCTRICSESKAH